MRFGHLDDALPLRPRQRRSLHRSSNQHVGPNRRIRTAIVNKIGERFDVGHPERLDEGRATAVTQFREGFTRSGLAIRLLRQVGKQRIPDGLNLDRQTFAGRHRPIRRARIHPRYIQIIAASVQQAILRDLQAKVGTTFVGLGNAAHRWQQLLLHKFWIVTGIGKAHRRQCKPQRRVATAVITGSDVLRIDVR